MFITPASLHHSIWIYLRCAGALVIPWLFTSMVEKSRRFCLRAWNAGGKGNSCMAHVPGRKKNKASSAIKIFSQFHKTLHASSQAIKKYLLFELQQNLTYKGFIGLWLLPRSRLSHTAQHDYAKAIWVIFGNVHGKEKERDTRYILRWKNEFSFYVFIHIAHLYQCSLEQWCWQGFSALAR